ncbi:MAG: hypothetical protein GW941_00965 [Candidatus Pacebacteria bacterium]|nr:hypothetical protein [Candidatus Paceibacterota bacterium]
MKKSSTLKPSDYITKGYLDQLMARQTKEFAELVNNALIEAGLKFSEQDKRFDNHDKRFDNHDKRFDNHDKRFDNHDKRFDDIDKNLEEHDKRFDEIDNKFKEHDDKFAELLDLNLELLSEIKGMREEMAVSNYRQSIHSDTLSNHDQRIAILEKFHQN